MLDDQQALRDDAVRHAEASPAIPVPGRAAPTISLAWLDRAATALRANWVTAVILAWIAVFAFSLRLTDVNWDDNQHQHPDERFLMMNMDSIRAPDGVGDYFNSSESALNPYNYRSSFVYGTLPLFMNKFVAEWLDKDADGSTHASANIIKWPLGWFGVDFEREDGSYKFDGGYSSHVPGRVLSAIFDVLTILLLFELGRLLYGRAAGLLAAGFLSVSVLNVQYSHFFGSETFLTFFVTATLYFSVRIWKFGGFANYLLAGLSFGLAISSKLSAMPVLLVPALAIAMRTWPTFESAYHYVTGRPAPWLPAETGPPPKRVDWAALWLPVVRGLLALIVTLLTFRIAQPYAFAGPGFFDIFSWDLDLSDDVFSFSALVHLEFLRPKHYLNLAPVYLADINGLLNIQSGDADFPPNIQWIGRTPFLFPFKNIFLWGLGVPLSLAALGGVGYAIWRMAPRFIFKSRGPADVTGLLPVFWILFHFVFIARGFNPTMRYFLPIYPALALMAAFATVSMWNFARSERARALFGGRLARVNRAVPAFAGAAVAFVIAGALLWGMAFLGVYRQELSRIEASRWMCENIPRGSVITSTEWDDGLPLGIQGGCSGAFAYEEVHSFAPDSKQKITQLVDQLEGVDYVVESSNRAYDSVERFPAKYPSTILYYKHLFDETLGFEKVAEFHNYPQLFGIDIPDQSAEEAFTVYDHQLVTIWKKTDGWSRERALELLNFDQADTAFTVSPNLAGENGLIFRPEVLEKQQEGGTFADIFDPGSFVSEHALFFWLLVIQAAAVALIPVTIVLFRGLPDRGYLLTKPLGVIGLSYLVYAPSSFGLTDFTRGTIAGVLSLMIIAGGASAYIWREELRAFFTTRWRFVLMCEAVFLAVFLFGYWLRVQNPDVFHPYTGGEKPMDLAYLTAMLKTTDFTQGPIDPWYSGGYMNYYWWGFFIAAVPAKLLGIVPEVAFNLIVPMFFALAAAAAFSVAYNLAEGTRRFMRRRPDRTRIGMAGPVIAGMLGVFFVLIAGNLRAIDVLAHPSGGFYEASPWHPDIPLVGQVVVVFGGLWESVFGDASLRELSYRYDWWAPSRALTVETQGETPPITEFPFWTFLFADLHAHLMAIPFALTVVGVSVGIIFNFTRLNPLRRTREAVISGWVLVAVAALLVGALRWINTWDYPVFMLIAGSGILAAELARHNGVRWPALGWAILKCGVLLALAHYVFFAVTRANYHFGEVYRELPPPRSTQTTDLSDFLSHFGVFLFFMAALGLFMVLRIVTRERVYRLLFFGRRRVQRVEAIGVVGAMILLGFVAVWFGAAERWGVFWLSFMAALALVIMAFREVRRPSPLSPLLLFVYAMAGLGFTLTAFVEVYTLNGDIGRMNTVFKFYLHTWELWALVAAYGAWLIIDVMRPQTRVLQRVRETTGAIASLARPAMSPWPRALRYSFAVVAVFLVLLTVAFPYFGTRARIHERYDWAPGQTVRRSTGNDGLAWLDEVPIYDNGGERGGPHELKYTRDALTWVRENIEGSPTTFEGVGDSYRSISSRFSIYAGLPTVAAWEFHQFQQRPDFNDTVRVRQSDVSEFYSTTDIARARELIAKYGVEWVFVGDEERFIYPEEGLEKFKGGLGGVLELAYENPAIQIWHVIPEDELTGASAVVQ